MLPAPGTNGKPPTKAIATRESIQSFGGRKIRGYGGQRRLGRWLAHPALREGVFSRWDIQAMLMDPAVCLGLATINSPLYSATWEVTANSPAVKRFVENTLYRFWQHDLPKVLNYLPYGSMCGEVLYEQDEDSGLWKYAGLDDFEMFDVQPLRRGRRLTAARVAYGTALMTGGWTPQELHTPGTDDGRDWNVLRAPKLFWCSHRAFFGQIFGESVLRASWNPWMEKVGAHGAISIRKLWAFKNAFTSGLILYPPGGTYLDANGVLKDNQDTAREVGEKMDTGAVVCVPQEFDEKSGKPMWEVVKPTINGDIHQLLDYPDQLDKAIWQGMGILDEVLKAGDVGGGWSGRSVPLLIFLNMGDVRVREILTAFDVGPSGYTTRAEQAGGVCRPLVLENFGPKARYQIKPYSLVPKPMPPNGAGMPQEGKPQPKPGAAAGQPPLGAGAGGNPAAIMGAGGMAASPLKLSTADAGVELPDAEVAAILGGDVALSQGHDVSGEPRSAGGEWTAGVERGVKRAKATAANEQADRADEAEDRRDRQRSKADKAAIAAAQGAAEKKIADAFGRYEAAKATHGEDHAETKAAARAHSAAVFDEAQIDAAEEAAHANRLERKARMDERGYIDSDYELAHHAATKERQNAHGSAADLEAHRAKEHGHGSSEHQQAMERGKHIRDHANARFFDAIAKAQTEYAVARIARHKQAANKRATLSQSHDTSGEARDPGGKWTHGAAASKHAAKKAELAERMEALKAEMAAHNEGRRADFDDIKERAEAASAKADEQISTASELFDNTAWDSGDGGTDSEAFGALETVFHDYDPDWSPADRFAHMKEIEAAARACQKVKQAIETAPDSEHGIPASEVAVTKQHLAAIVAAARAARDQLRTYVQHRKELHAIKSGEASLSLAAQDALSHASPEPDGSEEWSLSSVWDVAAHPRADAADECETLNAAADPEAEAGDACNARLAEAGSPWRVWFDADGGRWEYAEAGVALSAAWDAKKHPRGGKKNKGEFAHQAGEGDLFSESATTDLDAGDTNSHTVEETNEPAAVSPAGPTPEAVKEPKMSDHSSETMNERDMKHVDADGYTLEYTLGKLTLTGPKGQKQTFSPGHISQAIPPIVAKAYVKNTGINLRDYFHVGGTNTLLRNSVRHVAQAAYEASQRELAERIAADDAVLVAAVPGIRELQAAIADQERYDRQFNKMMDDENNDGARPPRAPKGSVVELLRQYPRAALYLRAESYSGAAHDEKASAGQRAMKILLAGGTAAEATQVLDNWLPANEPAAVSPATGAPKAVKEPEMSDQSSLKEVIHKGATYKLKEETELTAKHPKTGAPVKIRIERVRRKLVGDTENSPNIDNIARHAVVLTAGSGDVATGGMTRILEAKDEADARRIFAEQVAQIGGGKKGDKSE